MTTEEYYKKKAEIEAIECLDNRQKHVLTMELRTEYYGMDRSGLNHMDSANFKSAMIQVLG